MTTNSFFIQIHGHIILLPQWQTTRTKNKKESKKVICRTWRRARLGRGGGYGCEYQYQYNKMGTSSGFGVEAKIWCDKYEKISYKRPPRSEVLMEEKEDT